MIIADRLILSLATLYARHIAWTPIGKRVVLHVHTSRDPTLVGQMLRGVMSASSPDERGIPSKAIIELDPSLNYFGHYRHGGITAVRAVPQWKWHALDRLLLAQISVILIDCTMSDDDTQDRIVAFAMMRLDRSIRR